MCGIVGYVGHRNAADVILEGLRRLEYRGYDSAGVALLNGDGIVVRRSVGKIAALASRLADEPLTGSIGLGHTRWATHGRPSEANAHPHADCSGSLVVVHNGILENYVAIKEQLEATGHRFRSETDTEIIAHLVEVQLSRGLDLVDAVRAAVAQIQGAFAIAVLSATAPDRLVAARRGAGGVIVGLGEGETWVASDVPALLPHTRNVIVLGDSEMAVVSRQGAKLFTLDGCPVERVASHIAWDAAMAEKAGYRHFMRKEIDEQPRAVIDTFRGRVVHESGKVSLPESGVDRAGAQSLRRVVLIACGTSYHAAMVGRFMIERLAGLPAEVDIASEFRYRDPVLGSETLIVAISQSGETADTLGATKAARQRGARVIGISNVVSSALAREADGVVYTHAGPEIGVASTKTFTATITACYLLALSLGRLRDFLSALDVRKRIDELLEVPRLMERALALDPDTQRIARTLTRFGSLLYLGRGVHHPVALEGALKLKEISYAHAEGYAAGEMKHGPIALIDDCQPVVALAPRDASYERIVANIEEVKARGACVIAIGHAGDAELERRVDHMLGIPPVADLLTPLVSVIPLQLLAYHVATLRGLDVDQPRNLAKSVTVE